MDGIVKRIDKRNAVLADNVSVCYRTATKLPRTTPIHGIWPQSQV